MVREANKQISNRDQHGESGPSNIDLLCQMPDDLLIEIISLLPTKEAVRTSVLNKSWRNLWKQIHNINFSSQKTSQDSLRKELLAFDNVLENLDPSITKNKFCLRFKCNPTCSHDKLDSYLSWAIQRRVKMLALDIKTRLYTLPKLYPVPAVLFQCQFLVELELSNVAPLNMHIRPVSWPLLKCFNLTCTDLNVRDINNLIESCPLLESLSLVRCKFCGPYKFSSPIRICSTMLRCLKLWECEVMDHSDVVLKLPSLVKISVEMYMHPYGAKQRALLDAVSHVEEVHIGETNMQAMCKNGIKKSATVKHVQVEITIDKHERLKGVAYLISSYCNLHTLVVNFNDMVKSYIYFDDFRRVLDGGKVLEDCLSRMLNLKTIHVCGIKASEAKELSKDTNMDLIGSSEEFRRKMKFQIVRILLKKLIHLEKLTIYLATRDCSYFGLESRLVEETRKLFKQASPSPTLQVTCKPYDYLDW